MAEVRELKTEDLHVELDRLRHHLFDLRAQAVTEKLQDANQLTATRKDIARVLTALRDRGETGIEQKQQHLEAVASRTHA